MEESGRIMTYPDIIYIFSGVFVACFIDKKGKKGFVLAVGFALLLLSTTIFYQLDVCPANKKCY